MYFAAYILNNKISVRHFYAENNLEAFQRAKQGGTLVDFGLVMDEDNIKDAEIHPVYVLQDLREKEC